MMTIDSFSTYGAAQYRLAIGYFIAGQVGFFALLLVCILMLPQGVTMNRGFSYYGDIERTVIPYSLAFLVSGIFSLLASLYLPDNMPFRVIKYTLRLMLPLLGVIVITTFSLAPLPVAIHIGFGVALFSIQFLFAAWLGLFIQADHLNHAFCVLLFAGGIISLCSLLHLLAYLIWGQIIFQLAFGLLVAHTLVALRAKV